MTSSFDSMFPDGAAGADMDGLFRFSLWRQWGPGRQMTFVMLNPSTADGLLDDPTLRRCIRFAKREGCDSVEVVNLYPFRTHKPKYLLQAEADGIDISGGALGRRPVQRAVDRVASHGDVLVAAWGAHPIAKTGGNRAVVTLAASRGTPVWCFGVTKDGSPKHPLYLPADSPLIAWPS